MADVINITLTVLNIPCLSIQLAINPGIILPIEIKPYSCNHLISKLTISESEFINALRISKSKYISFIDSDDYWSKDKLKKHD